METQTLATDALRRRAIVHALRLEYLTVGWNLLEGFVAVAAAAAAGSVALLGFGIDSFVECASGSILIWRLFAERGGERHDVVEQLDRRARRLVAVSLYLLALYVAADGVWTLWRRERPQVSPVGIAVTLLSIAVMIWLGRAKLRSATTLGSRALASDALQTNLCWWLSVITLAGTGLNAALGWWWADPVAALGISYLAVREGREAWRGESCCR
ncbi:MAG TPA: cation transporter [Thermoanaerobaculia bacterium]